MYAIETELGRFEADTEREARKLFRKAEREAKAQQAIDEQNRRLAYQMAESRAYQHFSLHFQNRQREHNWLVHPGDRFFPASVNGDNLRQWKVKLNDDGSAIAELWGYRPVAMLLRPDGDVEMLWTQDIDNPERIYCMACGHAGGMFGTAELPIELFPVEKYAKAA